MGGGGTKLPPYVSLGMEKMPHGYQRQLGLEPAFLGIGHQPFNPGWPRCCRRSHRSLCKVNVSMPVNALSGV